MVPGLTVHRFRCFSNFYINILLLFDRAGRAHMPSSVCFQGLDTRKTIRDQFVVNEAFGPTRPFWHSHPFVVHCSLLFR